MDQDGVPRNADQFPFAQGAQFLVDALPRGADHAGQILLGYGQFDRRGLSFFKTIGLGQFDQLLGQAGRNFQKEDVFQKIVGLSQASGKGGEKNFAQFKYSAEEPRYEIALRWPIDDQHDLEAKKQTPVVPCASRSTGTGMRTMEIVSLVCPWTDRKSVV